MTIKFNGVVATEAEAAEFRADLGAQTYIASKSLAEYFSASEWAAILANNYSGGAITPTTVCTRLETAMAEAEGKWALVWDGRAYFKLNRPIRYYGRLNMGPTASTMYGFGCFYPDLSVDWRSTYPGRAMIESANYDYPTLPVGKASWPNSKPDFVAATHLWNITINGDTDSLYATFPNRVPDYGFAVHCANEAFVMERCYGNRMGVAGILLSGLQSTPTLLNCGGFNNGRDQDTKFGLPVTRTTGGAFGANVYVWAGMNAVAGAGIFLEAAGSTDLSSITAGNVLSIGGTGYTVSSVGTAATVNERTVIGGSVTTTRSVLRVTFGTNIPAYTQGRHVTGGLVIRTHPQGASFAPGQAAAVGGQGDGGEVVLHNFSGDYNGGGALIVREGRMIITAYGTKSENNASVFRATCNYENGGDDGTTTFIGYRCDGGSMGNQGVFRFVGELGRPTLLTYGKNPGTGQQTNIIEYYGDSTVGNVTNHGNGRGPIFWNGDSNRVSYWNGVEMWDKNIKAGTFVPVNKPTVTGSRGANAALASLLTSLANLGLITDSTSA